ncbi:winged helix-turn-helix domain-containing protein [Shouchella sp. 1P09AA]|uniref:ArsR/SmtB family transcription factor n=1 Tax=Bacillaceae TaxID=186817 RepID=UPI0020CFFD64|nr:winged helix-turn-helix domain-containing protein [Alkalihalobacillus sp. LMS6]UTR06729.1 winged helix-turn-helix domain-containing protein [Alkalihalobacillus sp. LMS6]
MVAEDQLEIKFKAISHQKRIDIIKFISKEQQNVAFLKILEEFNIKQSKLSYHLKILLNAHFIKASFIGRHSYYEINEIEIKNYLSTQAYSVLTGQ